MSCCVYYCEANCCTAARNTTKEREQRKAVQKPSRAELAVWMETKKSCIMKKDAAPSTRHYGFQHSLSGSVPPPLTHCITVTASLSPVLNNSSFSAVIILFCFIFTSLHLIIFTCLPSPIHSLLLYPQHSSLQGLVLPSSWAFKPWDSAVTHWSYPLCLLLFKSNMSSFIFFHHNNLYRHILIRVTDLNCWQEAFHYHFKLNHKKTVLLMTVLMPLVNEFPKLVTVPNNSVSDCLSTGNRYGPGMIKWQGSSISSISPDALQAKLQIRAEPGTRESVGRLKSWNFHSIDFSICNMSLWQITKLKAMVCSTLSKAICESPVVDPPRSLCLLEQRIQCVS